MAERYDAYRDAGHHWLVSACPHDRLHRQSATITWTLHTTPLLSAETNGGYTAYLTLLNEPAAHSRTRNDVTG